MGRPLKFETVEGLIPYLVKTRRGMNIKEILVCLLYNAYMVKIIKNKGFTLVELSIVIVIIGLIVAGVVGGQTLVKQAKLRSVITDVAKVQTALNAFYLEYSAIPGDMPNASDFWTGAYDGNGNSRIDQGSNTETMAVWTHLHLSDILF